MTVSVHLLLFRFLYKNYVSKSILATLLTEILLECSAKYVPSATQSSYS